LVPAILNQTSKRKKHPRKRRVIKSGLVDKKEIQITVSADRERRFIIGFCN